MKKRKDKKKQSVKMEDVAKAAGVSKSAVSKALNNKHDISKKVRERILKICDEMGYQVNFRIQDLIRERKTGLTNNIAFVTVGIKFSDPAYSKAVDGIAKGVEDNNLRLLLTYLTGNETATYELPAILRDNRVDGVIITGQLKPTIISLLKKLDIPCVILGTYGENIIKDAINVYPDIKTGFIEMIRELKSLNCQRIAYFTEDPRFFFEKKLMSYFESAMKINDLPFSDKLYYRGSGHYSGAYDFMKDIFDKKELPFDSIVCFDFRTAQEISHLAFAHSVKFETKNITIATSGANPNYRLLTPAIYYDDKLSEVAFDGVNSLVKIIAKKNETIISEK